MNLYNYTGNNPLNFSDPSGLGPCNNLQGRCPGEARPPRTQADRDFDKGFGQGVHQIIHEAFIFNTGGPYPTGLGFWMKDGEKPRYGPPANADVARGRSAAGWTVGAGAFALGARGTGVKNITENGIELAYSPRVRARALQDPSSHNFPFSFDQSILSTNPTIKDGGYRLYQQRGTLAGKVKVDPKTGARTQTYKDGVFEIGVNSDGVVDHRFFRPDK